MKLSYISVYFSFLAFYRWFTSERREWLPLRPLIYIHAQLCLRSQR